MLGCKFSIGDCVKIVDMGKTYDSYVTWITHNCPQYFCMFKNGHLPTEGSFGKVVCVAPHSMGSITTLYGVIIKDQIFILSANGLDYCNDYVVELL